MTVRRQGNSRDSRSKKEYDRTMYQCEQDDIWINLEEPKNKSLRIAEDY